MNVVLDTNVYLSALVFPGGICEQVIMNARAGRMCLFVSPDILTELKRVLIDKFSFSEDEAEDDINRVLALTKLVYPRFRVNAIKHPDADNRILECAVEANAQFLVTGDKKHILPLKNFKDIHIISPSQFLDVLDKMDI